MATSAEGGGSWVGGDGWVAMFAHQHHWDIWVANLMGGMGMCWLMGLVERM